MQRPDSKEIILFSGGIQEVLTEDCQEVIRTALTEHFELDNDAICIQRAHRIGRIKQDRNRHGNVCHRPIIVAFSDYQDCELILSIPPPPPPVLKVQTLVLVGTILKRSLKPDDRYGRK